MRLRMERGTKSILRYQLPIETILTRRMRRFFLAPAYHLASLSCTLPIQVKHGMIFRREGRLQPHVHTPGGEHTQACSSTKNRNT